MTSAPAPRPFDSVRVVVEDVPELVYLVREAAHRALESDRALELVEAAVPLRDHAARARVIRCMDEALAVARRTAPGVPVRVGLPDRAAPATSLPVTGVAEVSVEPVPLHRLEPLLTPERIERLETYVAAARELLEGRVVWNVNSTARGGGVAEMLRTLVAYAAGTGVDIRWLVVSGDPEFFAVTKRIHNRLHGVPGDAGRLDAAARATYDAMLERQREEVVARVRPGDVVLLHDPQTVGLAQALRERGALVVWRCHVGLDEHNEWTREAWGFLRELVAHAQACMFSREPFAPDWVDRRWLRVIPPSLDPFSPKNATSTRGGRGARAHGRGWWSREPAAHGRPGRAPGEPVGPAQGHGGVLAAFGEHLGSFRPTCIWCWRAPGRRRRRRPRGRRGAHGVPRAVALATRAVRDRSHLVCVPMADLAATLGSSTRSNAGRPWSCRRASPRGSASR